MFEKEVKQIEAAQQTLNKYLATAGNISLVRANYLWSLLATIVFVISTYFIFNFFLNFYFEVPLVPRFVKVNGNTNGVVVNEKINLQLKAERDIRLAKLEKEISNRGIVINQILGSDFKLPEYQGALAGVQSAVQIGEINKADLSQIIGYQKGVQSSYFTGNNYYARHSYQLQITGFAKGVLVSQIGLEKTSPENLFTESVVLIQKTDQFLKVNLNSYLNQAYDREYALRSYLGQLSNLEKSLVTTQSKVNLQLEELIREETASREDMQVTEKEFFVALQKFLENETQENLDQFIQERQINVDNKANLQAMTQIQKYLAVYLPVLQTRQKAIVVNREALIYDIKVVAFQNIDLGLIKSE